MRRRHYPGWRMVWALAATETVSYGVLYYAFAAFLPARQRSLAYSQTTLAGAFSLSVLVTGARPSRREYGWTGTAHAA